MTASLTTEQIPWGFVCGRINVLETRLLGHDFLAALAAQPRTEEVLRQLQETPLQEFLVPGSAWQDWSRIADGYFHARAVSLRDDSPDPKVAALWLLDWDFLNLRATWTRQSVFPFPAGMLTHERLDAIVAGDSSMLPQDMREEVDRTVQELGNAPTSDLDAALDGAYLRTLLHLAGSIGAPVIDACIGDFVLGKAIAWLWRAVRARQGLKTFQRFLLPLDGYTGILEEILAAPDPKSWPGIAPGRFGELIETALEHEEDDRIPAFEQLAAAHILQMARRGQDQVFGPERVFSYLATLKNEMYNVKLIVCGRLNRIDASVLKQRLRECYG